MNELVGPLSAIGWTALKALLLYLTAMFGFRVAHRRTLAEMDAFDFVAAVAVGAIVGRVPNADGTTYLEGAVTLLVVLSVHWLVARLRFVPTMRRLIDHPPRILVTHGQPDVRQLRRSGLTRGDLEEILRNHGYDRLADVRYAIFEPRGRVSILPETGREHGDDGEAVTSLLRDERVQGRHRADAGPTGRP